MRAIVLALLAACGPQAQPIATPLQPSRSIDAGVASGAPTAESPPPAPSPSPPTQDEILAAIQKAMGDFDGVARQCWASVAVERFDIEGAYEARIAVASTPGAPATIETVTDTTHAPKLVACMSNVLAHYAWAPPLRGQTFQLPFQFRAPDMQNVIDRRLVPSAAQAGVSVGVLLDEANTGNEAASMFEVAIAAGASTGLRVADRAELWYFETPALVGSTAVAAGDMMFAPRGALRDVHAPSGEVRAMIAVVPGGREGTARAGALPTHEARPSKLPWPQPIVLPARAAAKHGPVTMFAEPATIHEPTLSAEILELPAGAQVAEHVHAHETELLYTLAGSGTLTVNGVALPVTATSVTQIPAGAKHAFAASEAYRAVQIYTPAGPEQRFKP